MKHSIIFHLIKKYGVDIANTIMNCLERDKCVIAGGFLRDIIAGDEPKGDLDIFYSNKNNIKEILFCKKRDNKISIRIIKGKLLPFIRYFNLIYKSLKYIIKKIFGDADIHLIKIKNIDTQIKGFDFCCNMISFDGTSLKFYNKLTMTDCKNRIARQNSNNIVKTRLKKFKDKGYITINK